MMKKLTFLVGFAFLMGSLYAQNTSDFEIQGNDDGTMTILNYKGQGKNIAIPDRIFNMPVTRLQNGAFQGKGLTSVTIPATITFIGDNTFEGNSLTLVELPNALEHIGNGAFKNNKFTTVTIPANVAAIGSQAFYGNDLTSIVIPDGVKYIGNEAFRQNLLTSVKIGNGVIYIGNFAFYTGDRNNNSGNQARITDLTIGNNVMHIGSSAFNGIDTDSITLPNALVYVANDAFNILFPRTGRWLIAGHDSANWNGSNLAITEISGNTFNGYFDWYRSGTNYSGREYYRGSYNPQSKTVVLEGYRLENNRGIGLGVYRANIAINGIDFENGTWDGGVWEAKWQN
jgi:hypothetical protein